MSEANMTEGGTKGVRLPVFDGTHKMFQMWWMRFTAYAVVCKFIKAIKPQVIRTCLIPKKKR